MNYLNPFTNTENVFGDENEAKSCKRKQGGPSLILLCEYNLGSWQETANADLQQKSESLSTSMAYLGAVAGLLV